MVSEIPERKGSKSNQTKLAVTDFTFVSAVSNSKTTAKELENFCLMCQ